MSQSTHQPTRLSGKTCVITGGASGIGAGICRMMAASGAAVVIADRDAIAAEQLAEDICKCGAQALALSCDVTKSTDMQNAAQQTVENFGSLDCWVNNAGISKIIPFTECSEELWQQTLTINLTGMFHGCQAALPHMLTAGHGSIINMSSQSGRTGNAQYAAYCASKFGIIGLTQSLALEFGEQNIRVNALCPGVVMTPLWDEQIVDYAHKRNMPVEEVPAYLAGKIPLGRVATINDIANTALFLASDDAAYITGQSLNVSGGSIMH